MQFFDQNLGYEIEMPDGIDPTEANQAMAGLYKQEQARQNMMQGLGWAGRTIADVMTPQRTSPVVDYRAAAAMSPQALQNTMQMQQGSIDQENRVRAQQQMQQEQMAQMNYIEQARMRQRNAEMLQQQKDQRDMMKIRQQDYDMRQKEHEFNMRMKEDEMKEKERQAKMPQLHESSGMQYTYDETTNSYKGGVVPGAEAVHRDYTRGPIGTGTAGKSSKAKVSFLPGFQRGVVAPDGTQGWVNNATGQILTDEGYKQKLAVENAWEDAYNPKIGNYQVNRMTGEERIPQFLQQQQQGVGIDPKREEAKTKWISRFIPSDATPEEVDQLWTQYDEMYERKFGQSQPQTAFTAPEFYKDENAAGTFAQGEVVTPEALTARGGVPQADGSFLYKGQKVIIQNGQMFIEE